MKDKTISLVIWKIKSILRKSFGSCHTVCGLAAEQPLQLCFLIPDYMELHLSTGTRNVNYRLSRRNFFEHCRHSTVIVLNDLCNSSHIYPSCMSSCPQMKCLTLRVIPEMVWIFKLNNVCFKPTGRRKRTFAVLSNGISLCNRVNSRLSCHFDFYCQFRFSISLLRYKVFFPEDLIG